MYTHRVDVYRLRPAEPTGSRLSRTIRGDYRVNRCVAHIRVNHNFYKILESFGEYLNKVFREAGMKIVDYIGASDM